MRRWAAVVAGALALLASPVAAQEQVPWNYASHYGGLPLAPRDKPDDLRAREAAAADAAETACDTGDAAGCAALGRAFLYGDGRPQNRPVAELLLRQACDAANAEGCLGLGELLKTVNDATPRAAALAAVTRGCRLGALEACALQADLIEDGPFGGEGGDQAAAEALRREACFEGNTTACRTLGFRLIDAPDGSARQMEGQHLLERLCRAGDGEACSALVTRLRQRDPEPAGLVREMSGHGCDAGLPYLCLELGADLFAASSGPPEQRSAALALFDRACTLEESLCGAAQDIRAHPTLVAGCAKGTQADCIALGEIYANDGSPLHSPAEAVSLLGPACESGVATTCNRAAIVLLDKLALGAPEGVRRAQGWLERGCAAGENYDCRLLGDMLLDEAPDGEDRERGYAFLSLACERGDIEVCEKLEDRARRDPDAPLLVADRRYVAPLTPEEEAEERRKFEEERAAELAADRARNCTSSEVEFRGVVFADTICIPISRVIRGYRLQPGQAPWQALLWRPVRPGDRNLTRSQRVLCGGALIREGWILTAAHCVIDYNKRIDGRGYEVRLGVFNPRADEGVSYPILRTIPHPDYKLSTHAFDIALVQYDPRAGRKGEATNSIARIRIDPQPLDKRPIRAGMPVYTYGWGWTEAFNSFSTDNLRGVRMPLVDPAVCTRKTAYRGAMQDAALCTGDAESGQACKGDSGGPLITYSDADRVPTVIGVLSGGRDCGATGEPSRYTRVAKVRDWLEEKMRPGR